MSLLNVTSSHHARTVSAVSTAVLLAGIVSVPIPRTGESHHPHRPTASSDDPGKVQSKSETVSPATVRMQMMPAPDDAPRPKPKNQPKLRLKKTASLPKQSVNRPAAVRAGSPQEIARRLVANTVQYQCFANIVQRESGWNPYAENPTSHAYGLVQALPGSKMASAGPDWRTNPATQIRWGLGYMNGRYGSPCGAWSFWQTHNWY